MKHRCRASEAGSVEADRRKANRFFFCLSRRWGIQDAQERAGQPNRTNQGAQERTGHSN